jgi:hypothetical protein
MEVALCGGFNGVRPTSGIVRTASVWEAADKLAEQAAMGRRSSVRSVTPCPGPRQRGEAAS